MPFDESRYLSLLTTGFGKPVRWFSELDSTNRFLSGLELASHGEVVGAESQTAGRGRAGRFWMDEPGKNLLFSISLDYPTGDIRIGLAPLLTATAMVRTLTTENNLIQIKWPNDLMAGTKKLAGILAEAKTTGNQTRLIIGVGLNVNQLNFPDMEGANPVSLAHLTGREMVREDILAGVMNALHLCFEEWTTEHSLDMYRRHCVTLGCDIEFSLNGGRQKGTATGIDDLGRLQILSSGRQISYFGNEITHIRNLS